MNTLTIAGKVIRRSNLQPIAKLYVEGWDKNPERKEPLVSTVTSSDGSFVLLFDEQYTAELYKDRYPDIYFKVYAGTTLLANTDNSQLVNLRGNNNDIVIAIDYNAPAAPKDISYKVSGRILQKDFRPAAGYEVEIADKGILKENVITRLRTDESGRFETEFSNEVINKAGKDSPDLFLRIFNGKGLEYTSEVTYNASAHTEFNIVIGGERFPRESEFEIHQRKLAGLLREVPVAEIRQEDRNNPYRLLAEKTGSREQQVKWLINAQQVAQVTKMPPAFCYALMRAQLIPEYVTGAVTLVGKDSQDLIGLLQALQKNENIGEPFIKMSQEPEAMLNALALLPEDAVPNAFDYAIRNQVVPAQMAADRQELLKQWKEIVDQRRRNSKDDFRRLLNSTSLNEERKKAAEALFEVHGHDIRRLSSSLDKGSFGEGSSKELQALIAIHQLVNDANTTATVKEKLNITRPEDLPRLAMLSEKDWKSFNGNPAGKLTTDRIKEIRGLLEKQYPTAAFAGKLKADDKGPVGEKEPLLNFFDAYPNLELHKTNIETFFKENKEAINSKFNNKAALKADLKKIQRVFKLAPDYETSKALLEENITSSQSVYKLGKKQFTEKVAAKIPKEKAREIYKKAERSYAASLAIIGELKSLQTGSGLAVLPNVYEAYEALEMTELPDLKTLFFSTDNFECKDCKNIYSPAAYLTDLIKYLDKRGSTTPMQSAKKVLFKRRPDIGEIDLNCENSNTAIPYIDLVCEVLEDTLSFTTVILNPAIEAQLTEGLIHPAVFTELKAKNQDIDAKAAVTLGNATSWFIRDSLHTYKIEKKAGQLELSLVKQTHGTAAERNAIPEYINYTVYDTILKTQKYPHTLPFDLSWEESRSYLDKLGINRASWMESFQNKSGPAPTNIQIAGEFLGISPTERLLITTADAAGQASCWDGLANIDVVAVFLAKSGLEYTQLLTLLEQRFINPAYDSKVVHNDATADLNNKNISNLDNNKLDRIHRFLRLWRKTGWQMWELDMVLMNSRIGNTVLDEAFLIKLQHFMKLKTAMNKPVQDLVAWYGDLSISGAKPLYNALFQNKVILNPLPDAFKVALVTENPFPNPAPPAADGSLRTITAQLKSLAAVLKLKEEEALQIQAKSAAADLLSLSNISTFYRIASLTRKLRISTAEYYLLLQILNTGAAFDVFADPAATSQFIELVSIIRASRFSIYELAYLLLQVNEGPRAFIPTTEIITAFITRGRDVLQKLKDDLHSLTGLPDEKAKALIGKIASVDETAANDTIQIFNGTYTGTQAARNTFLDTVYGSMINTTTLKTALNTRDGAPALDRDQRTLEAYQTFVDLLLAFLATDLSKQALYQLHEDQFKLAADINQLVLDTVHLPGLTDPLLSYWFDKDLLAKDNNGHYINTIDVANFPELFQSYQLLKKIALLQAKLPFKVEVIQLLITNAGDFGVLRFDELPVAPGTLNSHFNKWKSYVQLNQFAANYPDTESGTLVAALQKLLPVVDTEANFLQALANLTLWDPNELTELKTRIGLTYPADYLKTETYLRLDGCMNLLVTAGIQAAQIPLVINPAPIAADAIGVKQLVKSKYENEQWLNTSANIQAVIRERKRDALVTYFTHHTVNGNTFADADALFSYYLLDTEMGSKEVTTRILQANLSIQLFVQRCLMSLEAEIVADAAEDDGWEQWDWMKYYQVWAANRKVFITPENWIEPELRLDKSSFFQELENDLMQNEVNKQNVENAYLSYLEKLDNVARLDVSGFYYEEDTYTLHVFARTYDDPHIYYYRKWVEDRYWTPWEKVDLEINATHVIPVVINRRLYLYWPEFREQTIEVANTTMPALPGNSASSVPLDLPRKYWDIHLSVSELRNNKWTPKKISKTAIASPGKTWGSQYLYRDYAKEDFTFVPLDLIDLAGRYLIGCCRNTSPDDASYYYTEAVDYFDLGSCHGTPEVLDDPAVRLLISNPIIPQFERSELKFLESHEANVKTNDVLAFQQGNLFINHLPILQKTPGRFRTPQSSQLSFFDKLILKIFSLYINAANSANGHYISDFRWPFPVGTFLPFFYEDKGRTFFVPQEIILTKRKPDSNEEPLKAELFYSDLLKILQEILRTGKLPDILKPFFEDGKWPAIEYKLKFNNFYHPYVCFMIKQLYMKGIDGMLKREVQLLDKTKYPELPSFDFATTYTPTALVNSEDTRVVPNPLDPDTLTSPGYPKETMDFNAWGSYGQYNWELFYHAPMMIAQKLSNNQQFEEAMRWYHYIFNPTDASSHSSPQRFWNTKPFFVRSNQDYINQRIDQILNMINGGDADLIKDVDDWRRNPFQPHRIAQFRTVAYQKSTVMKYLENLIAWGDNLFRTDTRENITAASQLYILAAVILGPKPKTIPNFFEVPVMNYNQLETKLDTFSNALIEVENFIPYFTDDVQEFNNGGSGNLPDIDVFYFCLPSNEKLLGYRSTIADRLFKIRHSMNIDGIERSLALFDPPIDPGLLVKAVASGVNLGAAISGLNAPLPYYRFSTCLQKANEFCSEVKSLGGALLSALEKRDAEEMALLRSAQEIRMHEAVKAVRQTQVTEAIANIEQLNKTKAVVQEKLDYYSSLDYMNPAEIVAFSLSTASTVLDAAIAAGYILAGGLKAIPQFVAGASGFGGSPHVTVDIGGVQFGDAAEIATKTMSAIAAALDKGAGLASTQGSYQRRQEDWDFQVRSANKEIAQIDQQIVVAEIRRDIAQKELDNQQLQIEQSKETHQYMRRKFTNQQLYEWMITQVSGIYFQSYQLAFDMSKRAERCYRYELGIPDSTFIQSTYWDSLKKGLVAGEKLALDLKRLDASYYDKNKREFELSKHISLNQIDPVALLKLKQNGVCFIALPEEIFDIDYPGHYFRRIKSVAISIPCIVGPYSNVNCTLTLLKSRTRVTADASGNYMPAGPVEDDSRFTFNYSSIQQIVTSSGQNDSGLFDVNLRDERYLPFEGHGAVSEWKLELNKDFKNFDFNSIGDVILHVRYTARQGGAVLGTKVKSELNSHFDDIIKTQENGTGFFKLISMKADFSTEFHKLLHADTQQVNFKITSNHLPYWLSAKNLDIDELVPVTVLLKLKTGQTVDLSSLNLQLNGEAVDFEPVAVLGELKQGSSAQSGIFVRTWTMASTSNSLDATKIDDILLVVKYKVV
ncbi:neuraminidase-like domain-containing protein [Longitalea arenae]|uniref:Tc toxin subunit A-related protein n=1 Tax=Longitalea arenae TaxID=2812558 RepID=UPI001967EB45|nr:neuraminidase-like domain-containing protein [Longitalea arenae]